MPTLRRMTAPVAPWSLRGHGAIGVSLAAVAAAASIAAVVIVLAGDVWDLSPAPQVLVDAAVGVGYPAIALVIARPGWIPAGARLLGRVMLGSGVAAGLAALCTALALVTPSDAAASGLFVQLQSWL